MTRWPSTGRIAFLPPLPNGCRPARSAGSAASWLLAAAWCVDGRGVVLVNAVVAAGCGNGGARAYGPAVDRGTAVVLDVDRSNNWLELQATAEVPITGRIPPALPPRRRRDAVDRWGVTVDGGETFFSIDRDITEAPQHAEIPTIMSCR